MSSKSTPAKDHGFSVAQPTGELKREPITKRLQQAAKRVIELNLMDQAVAETAQNASTIIAWSKGEGKLTVEGSNRFAKALENVVARAEAAKAGV